jgi:hypothetical protein
MCKHDILATPNLAPAPTDGAKPFWRLKYSAARRRSDSRHRRFAAPATTLVDESHVDLLPNIDGRRAFGATIRYARYRLIRRSDAAAVTW